MVQCNYASVVLALSFLKLLKIILFYYYYLHLTSNHYMQIQLQIKIFLTNTFSVRIIIKIYIVEEKVHALNLAYLN